MKIRAIRVLLIEDNKNDVFLMKNMLAGSSIIKPEIVPVESIAAGLEKLRNEKFDIIILDLSLPDSAGLNGLEKIRAIESETPVMITTGHEDEKTAIESTNMGAQSYFVKGDINGVNLIQTIIYSIDSTRLSKEVELSGRKLRLFMENATDSLSIWDGDLKLIDANAAFMSFFGDGTKKENVIGKPIEEVYDDVKISGLYNEFVKVIKTGVPFVIDDMVPDVKLKQIVFSGSAFKVGDGMGLMLKNMTEIKISEKIMRTSYEKLKELDMLKSTFIAMISHELRTPLTSIKGFVAFLLKGVGGKVEDQQREYLEIIRNNSNRLLSLINELLDFSKIESGTFSVDKKDTDIKNVVESTVKDISSVAQQKKIQVIVNPDGVVPVLPVDPMRLSQVLINIINNSIKFSPEETKIIIDMEKIAGRQLHAPDYADASFDEGEEYLRIAIKDGGPGITKENLDKVFERFYQVKNIKNRGYGIGLGLAISKNIVEAHRGAIWAESDGPGKGAVFNIILPIKNESEKCDKAQGCFVMGRLKDTEKKKQLTEKYCNSEYKKCLRYRILEKGESPGTGLLPDGSEMDENQG
ncbi:MAG: response regulator [Candidatus Goldbacteria bacterium]|nr:response regulator [Candidatus Goldiibacteriota bacterium]